MFEKESEEYADYFWGASPSAQKAIKQAYQQGAEFGYNKAFVEADKNLKAIVTDFNKANEWHFVKDGDLPKNTRYVWTNVGPSYYDDDRDCPCWRDEFGRTQGVIAWCEPKFEE